MGHITLFIGNAKIIHYLFKIILCGQAGVHQVTGFFLPSLQSPVIKEFNFVCNDKRYNLIAQTFFKQKKSADSSVAILKRVDFFKLYMKINQIMKRFLRKLIIFSIPPTSLGSFLYSPTANQSFRLSLVPFFSV